jgi:hypothetical protein
MKILFIIALISFAVLAWAAVAVTRHIRQNAATNKEEETTHDLPEARLNVISRRPANEEAPVPRISDKHDPLNFSGDGPRSIHPVKPRTGPPETKVNATDRTK